MADHSESISRFTVARCNQVHGLDVWGIGAQIAGGTFDAILSDDPTGSHLRGKVIGGPYDGQSHEMTLGVHLNDRGMREAAVGALVGVIESQGELWSVLTYPAREKRRRIRRMIRDDHAETFEVTTPRHSAKILVAERVTVGSDGGHEEPFTSIHAFTTVPYARSPRSHREGVQVILPGHMEAGFERDARLVSIGTRAIGLAERAYEYSQSYVQSRAAAGADTRRA